MPGKLQVSYVVEPDPSALAYRAALHLVELAEEAVAARGRVRLAVSGGSTPKATFELLADSALPFVNRMPWQQLELFWVDERTVPPDHAESNFRMTREALLDYVGLRPDQIHRIQGSWSRKWPRPSMNSTCAGHFDWKAPKLRVSTS